MAKRYFFESPVETWVGTYVYLAFYPNKIGIVREVTTPPDGDCEADYVRVLWNTGATTEESVTSLNTIEALIEDHRRRLQTHERRLAEFKAELAARKVD